MSRRLTGEERELWEKLRRSVRPLRPASLMPHQAAVTPSERAALASAAPKAGPAASPLRAPMPPPLVALEEREQRRLARGLLDVDARIDLHGLRQERAFAALMSFLHRSQAKNLKLVLVITGKGREGEDGRGVLRQSVPAWLARPEFRDLIVGFQEAGRRHGGAGALDVRLRRRREARRAGDV
jgi:DNA-nicking Smr family endonuclease